MKRNSKLVPNGASTAVTRFLKNGEYPHITRNEYLQLRAATDTIELRLLLELLWITGGRVSEVLSLKRGDLQQRQRQFQLVMPRFKRRKLLHECLPLPMDLGLKLEDFARLRGLDEEQPFLSLSRTTAWRKIRKLGEDTLDRRVTPHMFRHGRVYDLVRQGKHPFIIAKLIGHADLQTTMGYYHPSEHDLREAIES